LEATPNLAINRRSFIQSFTILLSLMILAGILTRLVPAGNYDMVEQDGMLVVDAGSFQYIESPDYPVWRWFTAPVEVLFGPNGMTIIVIIIFLLMVGSAFNVLERSGILRYLLSRIVKKFDQRKYLLLLVISLFFMAIGAFLGIFEEVVPLVPLMIGLSIFLGWNVLIGLGISILAVNMGFSAAVTNPFTIGVAQEIAGLPLFSGAWFRILIFITIYIIMAIFLVRYARKTEKETATSTVPPGHQESSMVNQFVPEQSPEEKKHFRQAVTWLAIFLVLILLVLVSGPLIPSLMDLTLPIVGLLFLIGGIGAGMIVSRQPSTVAKTAISGMVSIAPAIVLILMAASIQFIVYQGKILDTLLYQASARISQTSPYVAVLLVYGLALAIEFFVPSGSAKAFLLMPVLVPLADLVGLTRQLTVTAYCFGDGFSNLVYPTNPVLLICLGLAVIGYPKWLKWTLSLWLWVLLATVIFLWIGIAIGYGP